MLIGADTVGNYINYDYQIPVDVTYSLFEVDLAATSQNIYRRTILNSDLFLVDIQAP